MRLYLRSELVKSEAKKGEPKPAELKHTGEQRGGEYVARTQIGYESDGSPKYKYFKTTQEYQAYLSNHHKDAKDLKEKVGTEHKESKEKHEEHRNLLTEKSLRLYVRG